MLKCRLLVCFQIVLKIKTEGFKGQNKSVWLEKKIRKIMGKEEDPLVKRQGRIYWIRREKERL